jgi:hypothetical protein
VSVKALASRIVGRPLELAAILADEERRGRVRRDGDRWTLVADQFDPDVLAALTAL